MSIFLGGSEISGMYLGSNEISEMYLGGNLIYSPGWPYKTLRISTDGGITWEDYGRPVVLSTNQFSGKGITHVELPDSLTSLGSSAFANNNIKNIELPDSLTSVGPFSFENNELESLYIPESVKTIGITAFRSNNFTYIDFPETLEEIGTRAFTRSPKLSEVRVSYQTSYTRSGSSATFDTFTNIIRY